MALTSKSKNYTLSAWRDNNITLKVTQGEGGIKLAQFTLVDDNGVIDLSTAITVLFNGEKRNNTACSIECEITNPTKGIITVPVEAGMTDITGDVKGVIEVITPTGNIKFDGVTLYVASSPDAIIEVSNAFSALVKALNKIALLTPEGTIPLDDELTDDGVNAVQGKIIKQELDKKANDAEIKSTLDSVTKQITNLSNTKANTRDMDNLLATKLSNKAGSVSTVHVSDDSITLEKLAQSVLDLIKEKEISSNKISDRNHITDTEKNYPSIEYLNGYYYNYKEVDDLLAGINGALTTEQIQALDNMFKKCAFTGDVSSEYEAFKEAFGLTEGGGDEIPDEPIEPDAPTLTSISVTYTGGSVAVGTALTSLTGLTVKATYSDGSTTNVTGYTLSGTITEGNNTITVSYDGKTTTFVATGYFDNIEIIDIAPYYQELTQAVADEVNALGDEYVSFVAIADSHGTKNKQNSQNIARYLLKNSKANRLFHLGDMCASDFSEEQFKIWFAPFENCIPQVFVALGNHERFGATLEQNQVIYEDLLADKLYLKGLPNKFYYYFDEAEKKIRYMVINTSNDIANDVSNEQITWIKENVVLPSNEWKLCVFGHIDINPNDTITGDWNSGKANEVSEMIATTNGTIIGYFCGHEHFDRIDIVNDAFYQINLLNDSCDQDTSFEAITTPTRTAGTVSEQAVSVISINTSTGEVTIRRIGAGENMSYNYNESIVKPEPVITYTIERNLVNCTSNKTYTSIVEGNSITEKFTPNDGYTLDGAMVSATMGGVDISNNYVDGVLTINSVTGNVIISISTVIEVQQWADGVPYKIELIENEYINLAGQGTSYDGWSRTNYLNCKGASKIGLLHFSGERYNCFYDKDKNKISMVTVPWAAEEEVFIEVPETAVYFACSHKTSVMNGTDYGEVIITPYATA